MNVGWELTLSKCADKDTAGICAFYATTNIFFMCVFYFITLWKAEQGKEGWPSLYCEVHWQVGNHIGLTLHRAFETQGFICREWYNKYIYFSWTTNHSPVGFWTLIGRWGKSQQAGAISVAVTNHNSSDSHHQCRPTVRTGVHEQEQRQSSCPLSLFSSRQTHHTDTINYSNNTLVVSTLIYYGPGITFFNRQSHAQPLGR